MTINLGERERAAIIDAAYRCVAEAGDQPVRVSTILVNAGVSSRAFYRHFSSKDDLLLALVAQECDLLAADLDRIADRDTDSPAEQLAAWIATMFEVRTEPRHRLRIAALDSDEVRAAAGYREVRERCFASRERSLTRILTRGRLDGSLPSADPAIDAMAISALVSRVLVGQRTIDADAFDRGRIQVTEFASRVVGSWLPMSSEVASGLHS